MKNLLLILLTLTISTGVLIAQNSWKYEIKPYGGVTIGEKGDTTTVFIKSVKTTNGDNYGIYTTGNKLLSPIISDSISYSSFGLYKADSSKMQGGYVTPYDFKKEFSGDPTAKALNGWTATNDIEASPMCPLNFQAGAGLTSGTIVLTAMNPVTDTSRWSGVMYCLSTAFTGTIGAFNGIGIYRVDGGTYTLVASTGNVATLWNIAGAKQIVPFTTALNVYPGQLFYTAALYISSVQTVAPVTIDVGLLTNNYSQYWLGGDNKLTSTLAGQTSLPATITASGTTRAVYMKGFLIYK